MTTKYPRNGQCSQLPHILSYLFNRSNRLACASVMQQHYLRDQFLCKATYFMQPYSDQTYVRYWSVGTVYTGIVAHHTHSSHKNASIIVVHSGNVHFLSPSNTNIIYIYCFSCQGLTIKDKYLPGTNPS